MMQFTLFTLINLVTLQIVVTVLLSSVQGPVVSFLPRKCQIGREGRREHEQTEKHINPKLCAEIERTCAHFFLSVTQGSAKVLESESDASVF